MDTALWVGQGMLAALFLYSGIMKSTQSERRLVAMGQTGVEGLPLWLIRSIGLAELAGVAGLILPRWCRVTPGLTPAAALCLGCIMVLAAVIHYRRKETPSMLLNLVALLLCLGVAYGRLAF